MTDRVTMVSIDPATGQIAPDLIPDPPLATWDTFAGGVALHGLGGLQAPQSTIEGARGSLAAGCTFLDADMRLSADGVPILAHDNSLAPYTQLGSGLWRDLQSANVGLVRWQPSRYIGGSWPDLNVATIAEFLDRFGGKIPILLEPKNQTSLADWQASIDAVAPLIKARRLERSVMISLYAPLLADHAPIVKTAGLMLNVYLDSNVAGYDDPSVIPTYKSAGADAVSLSGLTSDATITAWLASGIRVAVAPNGRRYNWDHLKALGVAMTVDDNAVYLIRNAAPVLADSWRNGQWGNGDRAAVTHTRPKLLTNGLRFDTKGADNRQMMLAGDFGPLPAAFTIDAAVTVDTVPSGGKFGLAVCQQTDASFTDTEADPTGYQCWITMGGVAQIYTRAAGASTNRGTSVQTPTIVPAGSTVYMRVQVAAGSVTVSRLDAAGGNVMTSATYADASWRAGYLHVMTFFNTGTGSYTVKSLTVTPN